MMTLNQIDTYYKETVDETIKCISHQELVEIAKKIILNQIVDVYVTADFYLTGLYFTQKMMNTNIQVNFQSLYTNQKRWSSFSNEHTLAIVMSQIGEDEDTRYIVDNIKQKGGKIIALTSSQTNYLKQCSTYSLSLYENMNFIKVSGDLIMDILYEQIICLLEHETL